MTVRRRSHRRPLTDYASRSPLHALGVWLLRSALIALMTFAVSTSAENAIGCEGGTG